jgi:hypothetical protein
MSNVARTIGPLERKYAEISEELEGLKHLADSSPEGLRLRHALDCLKVSIRLFDARWTPRPAPEPRGQLNGFGQRRGVVGGTAIRIIGEAPEPITTHDIAEALYQRLEIPGSRLPQLDRLRSYLGNFLRSMERSGHLKAEGDSPIRWSITQADRPERVVAEPVKPRPMPPKHLRRQKP